MLNDISEEIKTVSEITREIKRFIEGHEEFRRLHIKGEISNFHAHSSGHMYFTLKDEGAALNCVMFRSDNRRLDFKPESGMEVIAVGDLGVYERSGQYQLYVKEMYAGGEGALHLAFQRLKKKLQEEGLFDPRHKKELPGIPKRVGLVTSPTSAALRDMVRVARRRYPGCRLFLFPTKVQGDDAAPQIVDALRKADRFGLEVVILGRGGGSLEDLWPFNEEPVARAVFEAETPIVSAVGHETDFTLTDFVADARAATPSAAAELVFPQRRDLQERLDGLRERLVRGLRLWLERRRNRLEMMRRSVLFYRPTRLIRERQQALDEMTGKLTGEIVSKIEDARRRLQMATGKLDALSPLAVLKRGYSFCLDAEGEVVREADRMEEGDELRVQLHRGRLDCEVRSVDGEMRPLSSKPAGSRPDMGEEE